jgi:hypothetical protein
MFWSGEGTGAKVGSPFSAPFTKGEDADNPNEVVFVGRGDAKAAIDLDAGDGYFHALHASVLEIGGFGATDGADKVAIRTDDDNHWIWKVSDDRGGWGMFWAGDGTDGCTTPCASAAAFQTGKRPGNPNEIVFVGKGTPQAAIDLAQGKLYAKEVVVQASWPDYVFAREYRAMALADVEAYIAAHGHLPEIPPASLIKREGLPLGESQALMLRKVEELTLYAIEQDKALKAQAEQIAAQQARIARLEALLLGADASPGGTP